jgi:general secretion pathway protein L
MPGQLMGGAVLRPGAWIEQVQGGWRWWVGELAAMLPARLREAFSLGGDAILITAHENELVVSRRTGSDNYLIARVPRDDFAARTLRLSVPPAKGPLADPIILQLPPEEALNRTLTLPRGARRNLADILRHEIVRHSPIGADDICYDYRIVSRDDTALTVGLRIVRRDAVEPLVELCRDAGIALSAIAFADDTANAAGGTFPSDKTAARSLALRPRILPALAALVVLLAFGLVGAIYLRGQAVAGDLSARVDAARARATVVERLQRRLDAANRQAAFLAQQKANPAAIAILAKVARLLPDDAWLYQFELNEDEVRLHGFSSSAASLIALIDASPDFHDAEMRSPLMQGPNNTATQRFDIAFKVRTVR